MRYDKITVMQAKSHPEVVLSFLNEAAKLHADILLIRAMVSPEMWTFYDEVGVTGLTEQDLLKEKQRELRALWARPSKESESDLPLYETLLKKFKENAKNQQDQSGQRNQLDQVQSDKAGCAQAISGDA